MAVQHRQRRAQGGSLLSLDVPLAGAREPVGDTLTEGGDILFRGVPSFAPEILRRIKLGDAMKAKKLREALQQMAEEGVVQLFVPHDGSGSMVGVVGALSAFFSLMALVGLVLWLFPPREGDQG